MPERIPIGMAWNKDEQHAELLYNEIDYLGLRFHTIVIFRNSVMFNQEYADERIRCRLEPGGTWIEVR